MSEIIQTEIAERKSDGEESFRNETGSSIKDHCHD